MVCYRMAMPRLSYWGGFRHLLHTPYISLVNLICGHEVVKELFAINFTEDNIRKELHQILHVQSYRQNMLNNYKNMKQVLGGPGASDRAAEIILAAINKYSSKLSIFFNKQPVPGGFGVFFK